MNKVSLKVFGLILKANYVRAAAEQDMLKAIEEYEEKIYGTKTNVDLFDQKVLPKNRYPKDEEDRITYDMLFAQLRSGEYERVYLIYDSKDESDWMRENAYPKEDRYAEKSIPERFAEEYHIRDNRIQTPEKFGNDDGYLHWFVSNAGSDIDVVHIDMNQDKTFIQAYSVSDEYFKLVEHFKKVSPRTDAWAKALGCSRREAISFLCWTQAKRWTDKDRLAYVNSIEKEKLGTTPDTQIVLCPVCGLPTVAAPASVGSINSNGDFVPGYEDSKQMTCEECGADLSLCFKMDTSIPSEKFFRRQDEGDDDISELIIELDMLRTEELGFRNANKIKDVNTDPKVFTTPWLVRKNSVPQHKTNWTSDNPTPPGLAAYRRCPAHLNMDAIMKALKPKAPAKQRRVKTLTPAEEARAVKIAASVKTTGTHALTKKVTPGATIQEIRKAQKR